MKRPPSSYLQQSNNRRTNCTTARIRTGTAMRFDENDSANHVREVHSIAALSGRCGGRSDLI